MPGGVQCRHTDANTCALHVMDALAVGRLEDAVLLVCFFFLLVPQLGCKASGHNECRWKRASVMPASHCAHSGTGTSSKAPTGEWLKPAAETSGSEADI
eukprot:9882906-Lingulodinium_polyedra.AAC.1